MSNMPRRGNQPAATSWDRSIDSRNSIARSATVRTMNAVMTTVSSAHPWRIRAIAPSRRFLERSPTRVRCVVSGNWGELAICMRPVAQSTGWG